MSKLVRWTWNTAEQHAQAMGFDPSDEGCDRAASAAQGMSQMEIGDGEKPPSGYAFVDPDDDQDDSL